MKHSSSQNSTSTTPPARRYGPAVGEPPVLADLRRWFSLIGVIGGLVLITYSPALGQTFAVTAWVAGLALCIAVLFFLFIRPVALGPLMRPGPARIATYVACVIGELVLINIGTRALAQAGHIDLQPALIATAVGVHFLPFAWAFGERMFWWLGSLVALCGTIGLILGGMGTAHAAEAMAVIAGLVMLALIALWARGRFAPPVSGPVGAR